MFRLDGKTALVTGASQGIGAAIARHLSAQGARVVLAARTVSKLEALSEEIAQAGGTAHTLELDLADPEEAAARVGALEGDQAPDILVNNAGVTADNLLLRMDLDSWQRVIQTNLTGTYAVTRAVVRGMMRNRWGRIISVSSVIGMMGNAGQANYAASKAGLIGFSKSLAKELGSRGITVNVVAPGYIETAMTAELPEATEKELRSAIPLRRLGQVDDVAVPVLFLASEEAGYITGHTLNVSGGLYI